MHTLESRINRHHAIGHAALLIRVLLSIVHIVVLVKVNLVRIGVRLCKTATKACSWGGSAWWYIPNSMHASTRNWALTRKTKYGRVE
jgi:hypothetical protein